MALFVKLAIISKTSEEASLLGKSACLPHLLYTPVGKQPYFMSTSSYKLSVKMFYYSRASNSNGVCKNHVSQNGR